MESPYQARPLKILCQVTLDDHRLGYGKAEAIKAAVPVEVTQKIAAQSVTHLPVISAAPFEGGWHPRWAEGRLASPESFAEQTQLDHGTTWIVGMILEPGVLEVLYLPLFLLQGLGDGIPQ